MKTVFRKHYLVPLFCLLFYSSRGQETKKKWQLTGDMGAYGDFYSMDADSVGAIAPRRPGTLGRLVFNSSLSYKDFSLPISLILPTGQYGVMVPPVNSQEGQPLKNLGQLIKNPLNRIGIAPKYKWAQLMLGSQVPQYSELSVGDLAVFGVGINLTPKKFRFSFFAGTSQLAVEEDTINNIQGIYARKIYSAKIGYGYEDSSHIYIIASKMVDDTTSLKNRPLSNMPQSGVLNALDFRINLTKKTYIKGEVAGSAFTRNIRSKEAPEFSPSLPPVIFIAKESSRIDYAGVISIGTDGKKFGIKLTGRYYGDGFVPMGYPFLQTDRAEVTIEPRLTLFKNKVRIAGSVGGRVNNLSGVRAATTTQTIGMVNISAQLSQRLSLSGSYSNFGFRNSITNDTFRVEMVTASWSISPAYSYSAKKVLHSVIVLYSQNKFTDFNLVSGKLSSNDANNATFTYIVSMVKKPFSISATANYLANATAYGNLLTQSGGITVGYKFFKKILGINTGLTLANNKVDALSSGRQLMALLGVKYTIKKRINFSVTGSINIFKYGDVRPGISYRENLLRTSLTYKF